jgi:hypothetical protein
MQIHQLRFIHVLLYLSRKKGIRAIIERITHLRNPISYIWLIFSHICKGTLQMFHDFKENCRITMEFSDKVDSIKYSTVP